MFLGLKVYVMSTVRGRRKAKAPTIYNSLKESEPDQSLRKSLSILQPTADNPASLVGCYGPSTSQKTEILNPAIVPKENSLVKARQSKRKAVSSFQGSKVKSSTLISPKKIRQSKRKAASACQESKIKSPTLLSNDTGSTNIKQQTLKNYTKELINRLQVNDLVIQEDEKELLDHPENRLSGISIPSESSGYFSDGLEKSEGGLKDVDISVSTFEAVGDAEVSKKDATALTSEGLQNEPDVPRNLCDMLCGEKVPDSYWKSLAEERQLAIEETLRDNELLQAQLDALQAENSRLQSLVPRAKDLALAVQDVFGK